MGTWTESLGSKESSKSHRAYRSNPIPCVCEGHEWSPRVSRLPLTIHAVRCRREYVTNLAAGRTNGGRIVADSGLYRLRHREGSNSVIVRIHDEVAAEFLLSSQHTEPVQSHCLAPASGYFRESQEARTVAERPSCDQFCLGLGLVLSPIVPVLVPLRTPCTHV